MDAANRERESQGLVFVENGHKYFYNGVRIPSVTQVIKSSQAFEDSFYTEAARDRGIAVHHAVYLDTLDDLVYDSLHPIIKPFFDAWLSFKKSSGYKPMAKLCEKKCLQPLYNYVGRCDQFGLLNWPTLIDIKTGLSPMARYQTAAYKEFPEYKVYNPKRFALILKRDGTYRLNRYDDDSDLNHFLYWRSCFDERSLGDD